jgi:hypothetical protein
MFPKKLLTLFALFAISFAYAKEDPNLVPSDLRTVTVYRNGAELTHRANAVLTQGDNELVIDNISNQVDLNSIQIHCAAAVTILSTEFRNNFLVIPESTTRIKFLQDSLGRVQKILGEISAQMTTTQELLDVLKINRDIKGQQNGLSVAELMKLMEYYKTKSTELQNELASEKEKQKKLAELQNKLMTQIREEETKNTRVTGQLHLLLSVAIPGKYDFDISYITVNAYWNPYYDIRVDDIHSPLKVIYKARVSQSTGIDWKKVKLSLSTSVPNQWGNAPVLKSWFLGYINPVAMYERDLKDNTIQSLDEVVVTGYGQPQATAKIRGMGSISSANAPLYVVNGVMMPVAEFNRIDPKSIKEINVVKNTADAQALYGAQAVNGVVVVTLKEGLDDYITVSDNELDVTFDIDLPYDVPSNGKEQSAVLKEYTVPATYKYYAVPKLDKDAYLLAEVPDWQKLNLLPGDANIIFEGTYVGKSFIDPNSTFDTLNLTLGHDKRVVVKKEKLVDYSSVKFLGSNKLQKFTYEITVRNNKKDSVRMLLKDQFPLSTNKEIETEWIDDGGASVNKETGVLTWKVELAPGESKKFRFSFSVKYPKDKRLNVN